MALFKKKDALEAMKNLDRTGQLLSDYKRITEIFKSHPCISIKEVFGAPPEKYHLLYKIEGLEKNKNAIEVKNEHVVEISLPPKYPAEPPVCKRVTPLFHPNISEEGIDIKEYWKPHGSLVDLIVTIGQMIAFQKYNTSNPQSAEAAKWADRNKSMLPLSTADLIYKEPQPALDSAPATEVMVREHESGGQQPQDDGRKTEGIVIDASIEQIAIEEDSAVATPSKTAELRKTAMLHEDKADTAMISPAFLEEPAPKPPEPRPQPQPVKKAKPVPQPERPKPSPAPSAPPRPRVVQVAQPAKEKDTEYSVPVVSREEPVAPPPVQRNEIPVSESEGMLCPKCGTRNPGTSNFCTNCGTKIRRDTHPSCPITKVLLLSFLISVPVAVIAVGMTLIITSRNRQVVPAETNIQPVPSAPPAAAAPPPVAAPAPAPAISAVVPAVDSSAVKAAHKEPAAAAAPKTPKSSGMSAEKKQAAIDDALKTAQMYMNLGSYDEALNKFMYVLKLDPQNDDALDGLRAIRDAKDKASADSGKK
jgi:ubiquitin-protein ligase